jgi:hypothetical protein
MWYIYKTYEEEFEEQGNTVPYKVELADAESQLRWDLSNSLWVLIFPFACSVDLYYYIIVVLWVHCDITKVLIIYHNWTHPLYHSPLSLHLPCSWNSFSRSHFSIFIHEHIHYIHPPYPLLYPSPSHW